MKMFGVAVMAVAVVATAPAGGLLRASVRSQTTFTGVQPHLASAGDRVYLTFGQDNVISVVGSADGGVTFASPVRITVPGRVSLGMHRGPRIAATDKSVLVAVIAAAKGGGADGDLLLYRSADNGASWASPVVINDVPASAREGLHALTATPAGLVVLSWLDLREKGTRIYTAVSRDHGVTWSADRLAYASPSGSVCECCHPSVAIDAGGSIAVMFRNTLNGNRDLYIARSSDGVSYRPAQKSGTGSWKLDACPMDGGGVVFRQADVVSVWRREDGVYLNTLGTPELRIGAGRDPAISLAGQHLDVAWNSPAGIMLRREGGAPTLIGAGRFPAIAALARRTVVAWEQAGTVTVVTVQR